MFAAVPVDDAFDHAFFDVDYYPTTKKWYFATNNYIAEASNLLSPTWTSTQVLDENTAVTKLKINPEGSCCAITRKSIWYSANLDNWIKFENYGYQWRSIEWFDDKWIAGAESLLTRHTFWTSTDGLNWIADNNQVQMMSFTTSP